MLRLGVRTFVDRLLDLPWLLVAAVRRAISTLRRRSPDVLDAAAAPLPVDGTRRGLAATARWSASAVADLVVALPASVVQRRFRPVAPRALAVVLTPIAAFVLVLVIAAQAPSIVRAQRDQDVLSLVVQKEPAPAAAVRAGVAAPTRTQAAAPRKPAVLRAATVSRRSGSALQPAASVEQRGDAAPAASARPADSALRASAPKASPRARPQAPAPDRPRRRRDVGGGDTDEQPKADEPKPADPTPTGDQGPTGGGEEPKDDEPKDEDPKDEEPDDDDPGGGGGGGGEDDDDDRGDRDRDDDDGDRDRDRDRDRGDDDDRGDRDGRKQDRDGDEDDD